jgi:hypothetical protein
MVVAGLAPLMSIALWVLLARQAPELSRPVLGWCANHAGALLAGCLLVGVIAGLAGQRRERRGRGRGRRAGARKAVRS